MAVVLAGTNVPIGTAVTVSVNTNLGADSTAPGRLNNGAATVNLTISSGVGFLQASRATFTISAELQCHRPL